MRKINLTLSLILTVLIAVGCSSAPETAATQPSISSGIVESSTPTTLLENPTASPTLPPTQTIAPTIAPTPIPTSPATDFNADNFSRFVQVQSFAKALEGHLGTEIFQMSMEAMAYSPDGRYVAIGGCTRNWSGNCISEIMGYSESFIVVQDTQTTEVIARLPEKQATLSSLAFSPNGEKLIVATYPARVVVWDLVSGQIEKVLLEDNNLFSSPQVAVSPNNSIIVAVVGSQLLVWDSGSGDLLFDLPAYRYFTDFPQFSADGSRLAVFSADYGAQITVYDTSSWEPISIIQSSPTQGIRATFSPDGMVLATYELYRENPEITLWDVDSGFQIGVLQDISSHINTVAFSVDGKILLVAGQPPADRSYDNITLWDLKDRQYIGTMHLDIFPTKILFSSDGSTFLADDNLYSNLFLWSLPDAAAVAVQQTVEEFFGALSQGDFETAASLFQPSAADLSYFESLGLNPADLPGLLKDLCSQAAPGCLPLAEIVSLAKEYLGDYSLLVRFSLPDGSLYTDLDGYSDVYIYAGIEADSTAKVNILPSFLYP